MSLRINEESLRKLVRSLLEGETDVPLSANPNVEPLVNDTQLDYVERTPVDHVELAAVISSKLMDIEDSSAPLAYKRISDVIDSIRDEDEKDEEVMMTNEDKIRAVVRKMIRESFVDEAPKPRVPAAKSVKPGKKLPTDKKRDYTSTDEAGGASFDEIAAEFGFAGPQGAKAAVEKALVKARFLTQLPDDDRDFIVLSAMDDYINLLSKKGDLSPEDVALLRAHPTIVQDLEGFRDHLHKFVLRGMREVGKGSEEADIG